MRVGAVLEGQPGIGEVRVNVGQGLVHVTYDAETWGLDRIREKLAAGGYPPVTEE